MMMAPDSRRFICDQTEKNQKSENLHDCQDVEKFLYRRAHVLPNRNPTSSVPPLCAVKIRNLLQYLHRTLCGRLVALYYRQSRRIRLQEVLHPDRQVEIQAAS